MKEEKELSGLVAPAKNEKKSKTVVILLTLLAASFVSVFGIYNTFSDINIFEIILNMDSTSEKVAIFSMLAIFILVTIMLQGVNFKRKDLSGKTVVLFSIGLAIAAILSIMFFFVDNLLYAIVSIVIIWLLLFLFDLVFLTLGVAGLFFIITAFSIGLIGLLKMGALDDVSSTVTVIQAFFAILLFIGATLPRIKSLFLKIGTRDNVEFGNAGGSTSMDDDDEGGEQ